MMTIFEYRCLDKIVLGKETCPTQTQLDQAKWEEDNWEVVVLIKLSATDGQLPKVLLSKTTKENWGILKDLEMFDKSQAFFSMNMLFSIMMGDTMSLQALLTKIKGICHQLAARWRKKIWQ